MTAPFIPPCESLTVEFKSQWSKDSIPKTLAAFANTQGGDLYIGVADANQVRQQGLRIRPKIEGHLSQPRA